MLCFEYFQLAADLLWNSMMYLWPARRGLLSLVLGSVYKLEVSVFWNRIGTRTAMQPVIFWSLDEEVQRYGSHVANEQQERLYFFSFSCCSRASWAVSHPHQGLLSLELDYLVPEPCSVQPWVAWQMNGEHGEIVARTWALRTILYCCKLEESRLVSFLCLGGITKNLNVVADCLEGSCALLVHCGWLACKLRHNLKCSPLRFSEVKARGHSSATVICKISSRAVHSSLCGSWDSSLSVRAACFFPVPRMWLQIVYFWLIALNISTTQVQSTHLHCQLFVLYPCLSSLVQCSTETSPPICSSAHLSCISIKPSSCFLPCHIWHSRGVLVKGQQSWWFSVFP